MHIDTQKYDNGKTAENTADATVPDVTAHEPDGGLIGIAPFGGPLGDVEIGEVVARNVIAGAVVQPDDAVMHYDRVNVARMRRDLARFENDCGNGAIVSSLMEARRRARMEHGIDIGPASAIAIAALAVIAVAFAVLSVPSDAMAAVLDTDSVQGRHIPNSVSIRRSSPTSTPRAASSSIPMATPSGRVTPASRRKSQAPRRS